MIAINEKIINNLVFLAKNVEKEDRRIISEMLHKYSKNCALESEQCNEVFSFRIAMALRTLALRLNEKHNGINLSGCEPGTMRECKSCEHFLVKKFEHRGREYNFYSCNCDKHHDYKGMQGIIPVCDRAEFIYSKYSISDRVEAIDNIIKSEIPYSFLQRYNQAHECKDITMSKAAKEIIAMSFLEYATEKYELLKTNPMK